MCDMTWTRTQDTEHRTSAKSLLSCRSLSVRGCNLGLFVSMRYLLLDVDLNPRLSLESRAKKRTRRESPETGPPENRQKSSRHILQHFSHRRQRDNWRSIGV